MQYALLEMDEGLWQLVAIVQKDQDRKWTSKRTALHKLQEEGWEVGDVILKKPGGKPYGIGLIRIVH